ncbi:hypothetical protein Emtol_0882 [Emticicia oligotrophica DSM 17448]|uniref:DUF2809 domain-containing protein n=1 Tax=Emticicia oligotrophica (strain DSM 17448 / CIP 109782 / MTCC 6937 / GPTSA100-15) TaxID=929562 RepID=A0ABM5MY10_EMTOG|nr:DUF2809 domain-containing protein [Emticicia oligotrophica]AFK02033.1 hypothetical protein Emtol_0882 [Emticicia oligotrophica DSM 17448]
MIQKDKMFTFRFRPFLVFLTLFIVEISIALWLDDALIRPFVGDTLAVILVFYFLKSFLKIADFQLGMISLGFAYFLELLQYCQFLKFTGLQQYRILVVVLGSSFDWRDLLAYTLGFVCIFLFTKETLGLEKQAA